MSLDLHVMVSSTAKFEGASLLGLKLGKSGFRLPSWRYRKRNKIQLRSLVENHIYTGIRLVFAKVDDLERPQMVKMHRPHAIRLPPS